MKTASKQVQRRLEYLRGEIQAERISFGEIVELQSLAGYIKPDDVELLEWASAGEACNDCDLGVTEYPTYEHDGQRHCSWCDRVKSPMVN